MDLSHSLKAKKRKLSAPKPTSRDGNMLKYLNRAQPSSTEATTLSVSSDSESEKEDETQADQANKKTTTNPLPSLNGKTNG